MTLPEKMRLFADLFEGKQSFDRAMTHEEYKFIKEFPVYEYIQEFWNNHLTPQGFKEYRNANSQGHYGKFAVYQKLWEKYNNPLARML